MSDMPTGWQLAPLHELTTKVGSGATPKGGEAAYKASGTPLIRSMNVHFDGLRRDGLAFIDDEQAKALDGVIVRADDVLLNITGASIGRVTTAPQDLEGARVNQHVAIIRPVVGISPVFVARWLGSPSMQRFIADEESGATRQALTKEKILEFQLPVAPLNEQRRIVEKLDAVFDKSRAAKARLERLPALLDKLKRSILAAAFRGDLTRDWRAANPDVEPASVLLGRIRAERRRRWEEGLRAKGKDPKKVAYEEPAPVDTSELPELPAGWAWTNLDAIANVDWGNTSLTKDAYRDSGHTAFSASGPDGFVESWEYEADAVVLSAIGARCGKCFRASGRWTAIKNTITIVPRIQSPELADFLFRYLDEAPAWDRKGGAQPFITLAGARPLLVPLPPVEEQRVMMSRVQEALGSVAALSAASSRQLGRIATVEQAALAKAFRGELVPQDPSDEPASALLSRIRAYRAAEPAKPRRGRAASPAPSETKQVASSAPKAPPTEAEAGEPLELVVAAFQQAQRLTASAIAEATGLDAPDVRKALKALADAGQVRVEGKARGTSYVWNG